MKRKDRKKSGSHIQGLTENRPNRFTADTLQEMEATPESVQLSSSIETRMAICEDCSNNVIFLKW